MIRIFTHTTCAKCPLCDNYPNAEKNGYAICAALKDIDPLSGIPSWGKEVPLDMSECPFPLTTVHNDATPGRMLVYSDCSECPACGNPKHVRVVQSMCRVFIQAVKSGNVVARGKQVNSFMRDCPFPEGRRFKGLDGDTVYGIGVINAGFPDDELPVWAATTSEGVELARAFSKEDLVSSLKRLELFRKDQF